LIIPPAPTVEFDSKEPSLKEAQEVVKEARTSSVLRQSMLPYRVYKKLSGAISVILFTLAMNMLMKSAEVQCRDPLSKSGIQQPPIRAFMDDLTVTTASVPGSRWILKGLDELMTWACMSFKPAKFRSLGLKKV